MRNAKAIRRAARTAARTGNVKDLRRYLELRRQSDMGTFWVSGRGATVNELRLAFEQYLRDQQQWHCDQATSASYATTLLLLEITMRLSRLQGDAKTDLALTGKPLVGRDLRHLLEFSL